ncbi:hypothetical protein FEP51_05994 [Burkholderia multivorans]|nr:hypothetical protein [Burkholderia multivorans]
MVKPGQNILFLVPSIALLSQTLRAWTADASVPLRCFAVCSDSKASRNEEDMRIYELAYPATTNANKPAASLAATQDESAITVIFSTYQSIEVVHQAQQKTGMVFDLVVCDEAHRTAGYTAPGEDHSAFVRVHDNAYIKANKRLYMTATPRIYAEASKSKAEENDVQVFSMDDVATFGPVFHQLRFDEAVRRDLLSDYKVLVIAVDELHVSRVLNKRIADSGDELKLDDAVKIVGCWNGLGKHVAAEDGIDISVDPQPMRTAIAFAQSIKHSKLLAAEFERISADLGDQIDYLPALEAKHVDGTMNVVERNQKLSWLKDNIGKEEPVCRILTNARCLSEGVDVPALDAAIFLNPRDSVVDVVQSVGRVMRKDPAGRKKYGYVILPIGIRKDTSPETALDDNKKYRVVWQVLNALRAHDDRLDKQFATIDLTGKGNGVVNVIGVGGGNEKTDAFGGEQLGFAFDPEELGKWQDAMFAKIVTKCGNRRYWEDWAKDIAEIADRHQMRIRALLEKPYSKGKKAFDEFLKGVRKNLNPSVSENDAIEMLAQHIITKPVFDALFEGYAFTSKNPVSQSMQKWNGRLPPQGLNDETAGRINRMKAGSHSRRHQMCQSGCCETNHLRQENPDEAYSSWRRCCEARVPVALGRARNRRDYQQTNQTCWVSRAFRKPRAVFDRDGSVRRCATLGAATDGVGASGAADAGQSGKGICERQQERCRRCTGDLDGGAATRREVRGSEERSAAGNSCAASDATAVDQVPHDAEQRLARVVDRVRRSNSGRSGCVEQGNGGCSREAERAVARRVGQHVARAVEPTWRARCAGRGDRAAIIGVDEGRQGLPDDRGNPRCWFADSDGSGGDDGRREGVQVWT